MIRVLIVDDDNLVRRGLRYAMPWESNGMTVSGEAGNGEKALEFLKSNPVDLVMTDLAMPVMSGIELIRAIRKEFPGISIAVLTLHQDFEYVQEALRLGAIDYIAKVELEKDQFGEVLRRIRARMEEEREQRPIFSADIAPETLAQDLFYDCSGHEALPAGKTDSPLTAVRQEPSPEQLRAVTERLHAFQWVHDDAAFGELRGDLERLRMPVAKLLQLLYGITVDWNRLFRTVRGGGMEMPDSFASWQETLAWLTGFREKALAIAGSLQLSPEVSGSVMTAVKIVHDELEQPLFAIDVAKRVNLSRSYFNQCFKEIVGYSFNEYLRKIRIDKAREYLERTSKPIVWIAEHTGYSDEKYFSRVFREQTGMLPSEYRQMNKFR